MAFFFSPKTNDFNSLLNIIKNFLVELNDDNKDLDEFKEKNETMIGKAVIIYFNDKNRDNIVDYFLKEYNAYNLPFITFVGTSQENHEIENKIINLIKMRKKIDKNIFKYIDKTLENNIIHLTINLINCAGFYNEIGNELRFPKKFIYDELLEIYLNGRYKKKKINFSTFNILVCGRPGVGKSAFINIMIKSMICKVSFGGEGTSRISKYIHPTFPIVFYDTPGISTENKFNKITDFLGKEINN